MATVASRSLKPPLALSSEPSLQPSFQLVGEPLPLLETSQLPHTQEETEEGAADDSSTSHDSELSQATSTLEAAVPTVRTEQHSSVAHGARSSTGAESVALAKMDVVLYKRASTAPPTLPGRDSIESQEHAHTTEEKAPDSDGWSKLAPSTQRNWRRSTGSSDTSSKSMIHIASAAVILTELSLRGDGGCLRCSELGSAHREEPLPPSRVLTAQGEKNVPASNEAGTESISAAPGTGQQAERDAFALREAEELFGASLVFVATSPAVASARPNLARTSHNSQAPKHATPWPTHDRTSQAAEASRAPDLIDWLSPVAGERSVPPPPPSTPPPPSMPPPLPVAPSGKPSSFSGAPAHDPVPLLQLSGFKRERMAPSESPVKKWVVKPAACIGSKMISSICKLGVLRKPTVPRSREHDAMMSHMLHVPDGTASSTGSAQSTAGSSSKSDSAKATPEMVSLMAAVGVASSVRNSASLAAPTPRIQCFLTFSPSLGGLMTLQWSSKPPKASLAYFVPETAPSPAKLKQNGGKYELMREVGDVQSRRYYQAWCQFVRIAHSFRGEVGFLRYMTPEPKVAVYFMDKDLAIAQLGAKGFNLQLIRSVAAVPLQVDGAAGTQAAEPGFLRQVAWKAGGASLELRAAPSVPLGDLAS